MYIIKPFLKERFNRLNDILNTEYYNYNESFNLIGSSNYPFKSVLQALGHPINLNPAEGFPGKRYFPNCSNLDEIELYGESLIRNLFNLSEEYEVSLQPHSGTQANHIVYNGVLDKGDKILAFKSDCGGHVSHASLIKKHNTVIEYGIDKNETIDYNEIDKLIIQYSPKLVIAGASSYPRMIDYEQISKSCQKTNSLLLADISHSAIYVISGSHQSPIKHADFVTMTTHKTTRGPRGGIIFFKKSQSKKIRRSIFPLTQGAPKFNEILAKTVMAIEIEKNNNQVYIENILAFSRYFSQFMISNNIDVYTSGSDSHLVVLKLEKKGITGLEAERALESIDIYANRNLIPYDNESPMTTSGLRFGFLTLATLGFELGDFEILSQIIYDQLIGKGNLNSRKEKVKDLINKYPIVNIANEEKEIKSRFE